MFFTIIVKDIQIHNVLNKIKVGNDFFIDAQIKSAEVNKVKKCNCQISIPNIRPGIMIIAFALQAISSIVL